MLEINRYGVCVYLISNFLTIFSPQHTHIGIDRYRSFKIDECTMFHLFGQGVCIAQKGSADFHTNGVVTKCPYYMDEICEEGVLINVGKAI